MSYLSNDRQYSVPIFAVALLALVSPPAIASGLSSGWQLAPIFLTLIIIVLVAAVAISRLRKGQVVSAVFGLGLSAGPIALALLSGEKFVQPLYIGIDRALQTLNRYCNWSLSDWYLFNSIGALFITHLLLCYLWLFHFRPPQTARHQQCSVDDVA